MDKRILFNILEICEIKGMNVGVYLPSGVRLSGQVMGHDDVCLLLTGGIRGAKNEMQIVMYNQITTIQPSGHIDINF